MLCRVACDLPAGEQPGVAAGIFRLLSSGSRPGAQTPHNHSPAPLCRGRLTPPLLADAEPPQPQPEQRQPDPPPAASPPPAAALSRTSSRDEQARADVKACLAQLEKLTGESGRLHALETKSARKAQVDLIAVRPNPYPCRQILGCVGFPRRVLSGGSCGGAVAASRGGGGV